jgi:phosphatidylglycerophosphate synthase
VDLHHTTGKPDWAVIEPKDYNGWQRIAAKSHGFITLPNVITILGFVIILIGLAFMSDHFYWTAIILLVLGRLCDLADGWIAEKTGTKSPFGEKLDGGIDKIATILTIIILYTAHIAPWSILTAMILPQLLITSFGAVFIYRKTTLHPSRYGKVGMFITWLALAGFLLIRATHSSPHSFLSIIVYILATTSSALGLFTFIEYSVERKAELQSIK